MNWNLGRRVLASIGFLISQPALAGDVISFSPSGGEHGIDQCAFVNIGSDDKGITWTEFGIAVDHTTLELTGMGRRTESALGSGELPFRIGTGRHILLSIPLAHRSGHIASGRVSSQQMEKVLLSVAREKNIWISIDSSLGQTVEPRSMAVSGSEKAVTSCVAQLKRELADERALRASGGISTRF
jgi:hypothetical protein